MANKKIKVLMPLPSHDFDPTEAGVTWQLLTARGVEVFFATPDGKPARADERMLYGNGLGVLKKILMARSDAVTACLNMYESKNFQKPAKYKELKESAFNGLVLPGGHAPGMKTYLEAHELHTLTAAFFAKKKTVGAICHGVVLAARARRKDGKSVLFGKRTTSLLNKQEKAAYNLTRLWLGTYYLTYPEITVQDEVTAALATPTDFLSGQNPLIARDSEKNMKVGFSVTDGNYVSSRWPGDVFNFAQAYLQVLK